MADKFDFSTFIAAHVPPGAPVRNPARPKYDFGTGFPDPGSFPMDGLHEALGRALKDKGRDLVLYPDVQGHPEMREFVVENDRVVGVVAIRDGRFVAVGSDDEIRALAGEATQIEDLQGAAVYLASSASNYANGTILLVDGGWMGR